MRATQTHHLTLKEAFVFMCLAAFTLGCPATTPTPGSGPTTTPIPQAVVFFKTSTGDKTGPTAPATFTLTEPWEVTQLRTVHSNRGDPNRSQNIGLKAADGTQYGPWMGLWYGDSAEPPRGYMEVSPYPTLVLDPGTYTLVDLEPETWIQNAETGGAGIFWVSGIRKTYWNDERLVFELAGASAGVLNKPTQPTTFHTSESWKVTDIRTEHWNAGKGAAPGKISLKSSDGETYGPWEVLGIDGGGHVPNSFWDAQPQIVIPPGTYTVVDSDPASWSQNTGSNGAGITWCSGYSQGNEGLFYKIDSWRSPVNGVTRPNIFTIHAPYQVTEIRTDHSNNGLGVKPGKIGLKAADGEIYGPWQATGLDSPAGVSNVYWVVKPEVIIPPGTYTVVDSDPGTWSQTADTGGQGLVSCSGIRQKE